MNKVFILDDRTERKKNLMSPGDLADLTALANCQDEHWLTLATDLPIEDIERTLSEYSIIAIHRSWLMQNSASNQLDEFVKNNNKYYIVFSGGTTQNLLMNKRKRLSINAVDFYSHNLIEVLTQFAQGKSQEPLLELIYGKSWRLPLLMQYRNILWLGGEAFDPEKEQEFRELAYPDTIEELPIDDVEEDIKEELKYYSM